MTDTKTNQRTKFATCSRLPDDWSCPCTEMPNHWRNTWTSQLSRQDYNHLPFIYGAKRSNDPSDPNCSRHESNRHSNDTFGCCGRSNGKRKAFVNRLFGQSCSSIHPMLPHANNKSRTITSTTPGVYLHHKC